MTFYYTGKNCEESATNCEDLVENWKVEQVFVTALDRDTGNSYFEGIVSVNDTILAQPDNRRWGTHMNITLYDPKDFTSTEEVVAYENALQTVILDNSCETPNLSLNQEFGAMQLVEFANPFQGLVTNYVTLQLVLKVFIPETSMGLDTVRLAEGQVVEIVEYETAPEPV